MMVASSVMSESISLARQNDNNKFAAIIHARKTEEPAEPIPTSEATTSMPTVSIQSVRPPKPAKIKTPAPPKLSSEVAVNRVGRPAGKGKKSDPNFRQVTAYVPAQLHTNATIALRLANETRVDTEKEDFSELLTRLLANWYEQQNYYKAKV